MKALMKCGHVSNSYYKGKPVCASCIGIDENSMKVKQVNLEGRMALCAYYSRCGSTKPSSLDLPFFEYQEGKEKDLYYCGCYGWD